MSQSKVSLKYYEENSVFGDPSGKYLVSTYSISITNHCHSSEFSEAASSMSDIVTSANGLVAREGDTAF